ncbi:hypothetical protein SB847_21290, partial [Bacillus sp. SIMBA_026]|uniref:hypothetical protein n=1 Tax=Bacillus sp. SIMBA_026 TaxID=3085769 RepID=UPI00397CCE0F
MLIAMVSNAVNLLGIPSSYDKIVQGVVIFAAAALDVYRYKYVKRNLSRKRKIGPPTDAGQKTLSPTVTEPGQGQTAGTP